MTKKISSLNELVTRLNTAGKGFTIQIEKAIIEATVKVQTTAVSKFGTYQPDVGPFQAWAVLNPDTVRLKALAGGGDDPLIGHYAGKRKNSVYPAPLRNTITTHVQGLTGAVGTNDPLGKWHEFGTTRFPPRPFLRPALYQNKDWIKARIAEAVAIALAKY